MNTDKIIAESIAKDYAPKESSKLVALKKLDNKAKLPATIFTYSCGIISALVFGTGMCLSMQVIGNGLTGMVAALFSAMSLILGKFLQIPTPFAEIIRISFENLPILMAGITMGPLVGAAVGVVADLLGCLLYGYSINPLITLGALTVGLVSGLMAHYVVRRPPLLRIVFATVAAHLLGSVLIKSLGLAAWYLSRYSMGLAQLMLWRTLNYALIGAAEAGLLYLLLGHRGLSSQLERMLKK